MSKDELVHLSGMWLPSSTVCTGRYPRRSERFEVRLGLNLLQKTRVKSRMSSLELVCQRQQGKRKQLRHVRVYWRKGHKSNPAAEQKEMRVE